MKNPDGSTPNLCEVCGVDHNWVWADLSHGIIRLMVHAQERITWMEWLISGDMIARQRAGILGKSLAFSTTDPQDIDWEAVDRADRAKNQGEGA
jgi:hypothetical protein